MKTLRENLVAAYPNLNKAIEKVKQDKTFSLTDHIDSLDMNLNKVSKKKFQELSELEKETWFIEVA
jgi:hypothetical protein